MTTAATILVDAEIRCLMQLREQAELNSNFGIDFLLLTLRKSKPPERIWIMLVETEGPRGYVTRCRKREHADRPWEVTARFSCISICRWTTAKIQEILKTHRNGDVL